MKRRVSILTPFVLIFALIIKVFTETNRFKVNHVEFTSDKLPEGAELKVLQLSDLHNKIFGRNNKRLVRAVKKADAHIIVLTGDLISKDTTDLAAVFSLVERLKKVNENVFFISGNHDWANEKSEEFFQGLREREVIMLDNRRVELSMGSFIFNLVGIADASTKREDMYEVFAGMERERYTILLSHTPGVVNMYTRIPADLILSGHTHGGQVRLPFVGAVIAPDQGLFPKLDKGTFEVGKNGHLYIDSGLGTSRAPLRFMNKSQMSLIRITNE